MKAVLRFMGALGLSVLALSGCAFAPVAPPSDGDAPQTRAAIARSAAPASPAPLPTAAGFSLFERAALRVRNLGCGEVATGSGFAIGDHVFVTNRHVVVGAAVLQVSTYDGKDITVNAVSTAVIADLALVWTSDPLPAKLRLAMSNAPVGAAVTAVGYPLGGKLTSTSGRVLRYGPDPLGSSPLPVMYDSAPIEHGSSGSALVDASGLLIGVAYAGGGGEYVAVPVETLDKALNDPSKFSKGTGCG